MDLDDPHWKRHLLYKILYQQELIMSLATQLKAATDALQAEVATVIQLSGAVTPDADVQAGIDAVTAATSTLSTAFPKP